MDFEVVCPICRKEIKDFQTDGPGYYDFECMSCGIYIHIWPIRSE